MDLITHLLTGELICQTTDLNLIRPAVYIGCILPDIGEIRIQRALARKFGEKIAVYDERTSDINIAGDINITNSDGSVTIVNVCYQDGSVDMKDCCDPSKWNLDRL